MKFAVCLLSFAPLALAATSLAQQPALQADWVQNPTNGNWYGVDYSILDWTESQTLAQSLGGNLATIRSQVETDWVANQFSYSKPAGGGLWIGLFQDFSDPGYSEPAGGWVWASTEASTYTNWALSEPTDWNGIEHWCVMGHYAPWGQWNDNANNKESRALIELQGKPQVGWSWPQLIPTGDQPQVGALADLDGDGDLDYASPDASSGSGTGQVSVHWNNGTGVFLPGPKTNVMNKPRTLVATDTDADGDLDLVVACDGGELRVLTQDSGSFVQGALLDSGVAFHGLTLADINSDGIDDLVATAITASSKDWVLGYFGQAGGGFGSRVFIDQRLDTPVTVTAADVDADGDLDVLVAYDSSKQIGICFNDGAGTFSTKLDLWIGSSPANVSLADLDLDGDLDLIVPLKSSGLEVWNNDGLGNFNKLATYPTGSGANYSAVADIDGDALADVVVPCRVSGEVWVYYGDGTGQLIPSYTLAGHQGASFAICGDLDGDTVPDLVVAREGAASLAAWNNNQGFVDCNANGVPDNQDIADGTSADCDGNGIPDECDLANASFDCDGNGLIDSCEIVNDPAMDCDGDKVLDSCQIAGDPSLDQDGDGVLDSCQCAFSTFCFSTQNSTGQVGIIGWSGSASISAADLTITGSNLPTNQFGIFFYGADEWFKIMGDGVLCIAPPLYRIKTVVTTGPTGTANLTLDYGSQPLASGAGQVVAFSTWRFQLWYRDPTGGPAGSNTTDGLMVTFCP